MSQRWGRTRMTGQRPARAAAPRHDDQAREDGDEDDDETAALRVGEHRLQYLSKLEVRMCDGREWTEGSSPWRTWEERG
jgi:hypothetical protein